MWPQYISQLVCAYNTTTHRSTGQSPYSLMFRVPPRLPVDSLLVTDVLEADKNVMRSWEDWVQHRQERLRVAHSLAHKSLKDAAEYRQQHHNNQVHDTGFSKGQLIYLKDHSLQGRRKIQDVWSPVLYQVGGVTIHLFVLNRSVRGFRFGTHYKPNDSHIILLG